MYTFLTSSLKIASGEISTKEVAGESGGKARNITGKKQLSPSTHQNNVNRFKSILSKIRNKLIAKASPSIHPSNPIITHPEERIWAGQTPRRKPRVPDAPKIKHDRMKQFYMVDMGRKRW
jgi:hypothetical protein